MSTGPFLRLNVSTDGHKSDQLKPGQEWSFGRSMGAKTSRKHSVLVDDPRMSHRAIVICNDDGWPTVRTESNAEMELDVHVRGLPVSTIRKLHGAVSFQSADFDVHLVFDGTTFVVKCRNSDRQGLGNLVISQMAPEEPTTELAWDFDVLCEGRPEDTWRVPVVAALAYAATRHGTFDTGRKALELPRIKRVNELSSDFSGRHWNNDAFYKAMDTGLHHCCLPKREHLDGREPLELLINTLRAAVPQRTIRLVAERLLSDDITD